MGSKKKKEKKKTYTSPYQEQLDTALNGILNRTPFSYNMNADPLYNMYKDMYTAQGEYDMRNAIGEGASMTGGYASSAATAAGNTAYQAQMSALNNKVPELYQSALGAYQTNMNDTNNMYSVLNQADQTAYNRFRDNVADSYADKNFALQQKQFNFTKEKYGLK